MSGHNSKETVHAYAGWPGKAYCLGADTPIGTRSHTSWEQVTCVRCWIDRLIGDGKRDNIILPMSIARELQAFLTAKTEPGAELSVDPAFEGTFCPFTKRPYFMHLEHPELGRVPTYGGPFDSYTVPVPADDNEFTLRCERYDHDAGAWVEGGEPLPWHVISNDELARLHNAGASRPSVLDAARAVTARHEDQS